MDRKPYEKPEAENTFDLDAQVEHDVTKWRNVSGVPIFPPPGEFLEALGSAKRASVGYEEALLRGVKVDDDKYRFYLRNGDYRIFVERHGQPWVVLEAGSKAVLSMLVELLELRERVEELERQLHNERGTPEGREAF